MLCGAAPSVAASAGKDVKTRKLTQDEELSASSSSL